jgi:hypothetical protein
MATSLDPAGGPQLALCWPNVKPGTEVVKATRRR